MHLENYIGVCRLCFLYVLNHAILYKLRGFP